MTIEIYSERQDAEEEPLRLRLFKVADGSVCLTAVDKGGRRLSGGDILTVEEDGSIYLCSACLAPGLQTNSAGKVKVAQ